MLNPIFIIVIVIIFIIIISAMRIVLLELPLIKYHLKKFVQISAEIGYFEGQKDCLVGDVRISWSDSLNQWIWLKSPWDIEREPIFDTEEIKKFTKNIK